MLNSKQEFSKMAEVESSHWWYRTLHDSVWNQIKIHPKNIDVSVIDAGCGTDGLLQYLHDKGLKSLTGIDLSEYAVDTCKERGFEVEKENILTWQSYFQNRVLIFLFQMMSYISFLKKNKYMS